MTNSVAATARFVVCFDTVSRDAEVIVLALFANEVMEPLLRYDENRSWKGWFVPIEAQTGTFAYGWATEFVRVHSRTGLLAHLESLPWPHPESVQVLIHDEEDHCFGLWMLHDGKLVEIELPRTRRWFPPASSTPSYSTFPTPGVLQRTDRGSIPEQTPESERDPRPAW